MNIFFYHLLTQVQGLPECFGFASVGLKSIPKEIKVPEYSSFCISRVKISPQGNKGAVYLIESISYLLMACLQISKYKNVTICLSDDSADIEAIYQVARTGEAQRLADCNVDNHKMLWHGSRTSNLISIFSRGLLIAPKDAPATGYAFGKVSTLFSLLETPYLIEASHK